jgi:endonuclease-3 related protein
MDGRFLKIYKILFGYFGKQNWWPAKTRLEVIVGAILTQNTSWLNVERAIGNLKNSGVLTFNKLSRINTPKLARLIKPAGYFNVKARRLKNALVFMQKFYKGDFKVMNRANAAGLREQLLSVNGIGPETADSILLYAFDKPVFVVDAYTKRVFSRLNIISPDAVYHEVQDLFMANLDSDTRLFNEYHALIVRLGKDYCKKNKPLCDRCPIRNEH